MSREIHLTSPGPVLRRRFLKRDDYVEVSLSIFEMIDGAFTSE